MTFITSDPTAPYRHALNAWVFPLATCALPKGVCYLLTYLRAFILDSHTIPSPHHLILDSVTCLVRFKHAHSEPGSPKHEGRISMDGRVADTTCST